MGYIANEVTDELQFSTEEGGKNTVTRSWKVLGDTVDGNLLAVRAACGVYIGQPIAGGNYCTSIRVRASADNRYLYIVSAEYTRTELKTKDPLKEKDKFSWSFSLSSEPAVKALSSPTATKLSKPILNSAGDPIEGLMRDVAEVRLRIAGNRASFAPSLALNYTNTLNGDTYAGSEKGTWKCQGIEAAEQSVYIDDGAGGEVELLYWAVTVELAYKADGWQARPWDAGYNELVNGKKVKIAVPRVESLPNFAAMEEGDKNRYREEHAAHDIQGLDRNGKALAEGVTFTEANVREFDLYREVPWSGVFSDPALMVP